jgi:hypothetical protein
VGARGSSKPEPEAQAAANPAKRLSVPPELIQIVPPGEGGVFDYAQCLQAQWALQGVASKILPLSAELAQQTPLTEHIGGCLAVPVSQTLQPHCVVLHYSGYGYARRGLCFWLIDVLRALRARHGSRLRLVIVFHELFASGPPWRSAFWLSPAQALIAARLARLSDAIWTNTEQHAQWLHSVVNVGQAVRVKPVFSNIGEPDELPLASQRRPVAVVFGSQSTRQRAFDALRGEEAKLQRLGIEELIEVGGGAVTREIAMPCRRTGRLAVPELRDLLLQSRFGLLDYPSQFLCKSGVFAAYAAHGSVVLDTCRPGPDTDRLVAGVDYINLATLSEVVANPTSHDTMAMRTAHWYAGHRLSDQARELLALA